MTRRVLSQHNLFAVPVLHAEIIDAANFTARDDTVSTCRAIDLLADYRHGARVLDQFRSNERLQGERSPPSMALSAGKGVARLDLVIHDAEPDVEPVLVREYALVIRLHTLVRNDNRRPTLPDVDGKLDDGFSG